jgi:cell wall-associated NlpC family hydrolase
VLPAALLLLAACAPFQPETRPGGAGREPVGPESGQRIARDAAAQIGAPYRYGGADPAQGFDCSGLVTYVYRRNGIAVPRTAAQQFAAARPLREEELRLGDLLFFRLGGPRSAVSHVGIYTGQRRFVHAPQTGRQVSAVSLDEPYLRARLAGFGRLIPSRSD